MNKTRNASRRAAAFAAVAFCMANAASAAVLDYYRFENNYADSGVGGHTATVLTGTPGFSASVASAVVPLTGQANTASASLGTAAALSFNYAFPFNTATNATLEFYVNPSAAGNEQDLFWTTTAPTDANRFNIGILPDGSMFVDYREPGGALHQLGTVPAGAIVMNQWNFVAIVKAGNTYSIYVNAVPPVVTTDTTPNLPTSTGWTINGRVAVEPNACCQFSGLVDEVRISDQALTPAQFLNARAPTPPSPVPIATELVPLLVGVLGLLAWFALRRGSTARVRPTTRR